MNRITDCIHKYYYPICLIGIVLFALFLRTYRLTGLPRGLHVDEVGLGYNAWSLAHFGTDRYLNSFPIYFKNYNSGQSPFYTYFVALLLKLSGGQLSVFLLRLPAVILSLLAVIFGAEIIRLCLQSKKAALVSGILLTVCPYFIMQGRLALDCNAMFGCCMIALYLLIRYIHTQKIQGLVLCGAAFGVVMYTYALSYITLAIFLILTALYLLYVKKITVTRTALTAACICVTAMPVILFALSVIFHWPSFRILGLTIAPVSAGRASELSLQGFWANIGTIIRSIVTYDQFPFTATSYQGTLYYISIPFIITGFITSCVRLVSSIRKRCFHPCVLFLTFFLSELFTAGLTAHPYIHNINAVFIPLLFFLVSGLYINYRFICRYRSIFICVVSLVYALNMIAFFRYYFCRYDSIAYTWLFQASASDAVRYANENLSFSRLYIDYQGFSEYNIFDDPIHPREWLGEDTDTAQAYYIDSYSHYCCVTDPYAAVDPSAIYIVKPENIMFLRKLESLGLPGKKLTFPSGYILYDFEE